MAARVSVLRSWVAGAKIQSPPFACHCWVEPWTEVVVSNGSDSTASLEMAKLDNDDVALLDKSVHPFDYEKAVKIRGRATGDRACAHSTRQR